MGASHLWFVLTSLAVAYAVRRITRKYLPKVHFNPKGSIAKYVEKMKVLSVPYVPTAWLAGPDVHTIWGMKQRPSSKLVPRREPFTFSDGGNSIFDWFEPKDCQANAPVLIIVHSLAGGTREPCTNNMAESAVNHGWRAVVANERGCSGAKYTSKKSFTSPDADDVHELVKHIRSIYCPRSIFLLGFSFGSTQCVTLSTEEPEIDGVACVSPLYRANETSKILERPINRQLYLKIMTQKAIKLEKKNPFAHCYEAECARTLAEFDDAFTAKLYGYHNHVDLYEAVSINYRVGKARTPILFVGADDDPFISPSHMPIAEVTASENAALIHVPEGGHLGMCEGKDGQRSYFEDVVFSWFDAIDDVDSKM